MPAGDPHYSHILPRAGRRNDAPRLYSKTVVTTICNLTIKGYSTNRICKMKRMPSRVTLGKWLRKYPDFAERFLQAKQIQTYFNVDDIKEIAEDCDGQSGSEVAKAKLRVDTLKWEASKMVPKIYGDKASLDIKRDDGVSDDRMTEIVSNVLERLQPKPLEITEESGE